MAAAKSWTKPNKSPLTVPKNSSMQNMPTCSHTPALKPTPLLAVLKPGDTFMGLNLDHGGHLSHGSAVNTSGILYHPVGYNLCPETGRVDYDEMERLALEHKPKLIIGGGSAYSREWDYKRMQGRRTLHGGHGAPRRTDCRRTP